LPRFLKQKSVADDAATTLFYSFIGVLALFSGARLWIQPGFQN